MCMLGLKGGTCLYFYTFPVISMVPMLYVQSIPLNSARRVLYQIYSYSCSFYQNTVSQF